jgi:hypothetical protein
MKLYYSSRKVDALGLGIYYEQEYHIDGNKLNYIGFFLFRWCFEIGFKKKQ